MQDAAGSNSSSGGGSSGGQQQVSSTTTSVTATVATSGEEKTVTYSPAIPTGATKFTYSGTDYTTQSELETALKALEG